MEVYHNGEWGTVCGDGWDLNDAQVVCNELGIGKAAAVRHNAFYGEGNDKIWLSNPHCIGTELSIKDCWHRGWGIRNCNHSQDVGIKCVSGNFIADLQLFLLQHHYFCIVRLDDGPNKYEGRVEVYHISEWGTVCDDGWNLNNAHVVCNELGFGNAISVEYSAFYGQGRGRIWLDDVQCIGKEWTIGNCSHRGWGMEYCSHYDDVGVKCTNLGNESNR